MTIHKIRFIANPIKLPRRESVARIHFPNATNDERGTILIIAPFILLVTLTLASLVIDLNALYTAKTALQDRIQAIASAAANQVSPTILYGRGEISIDQARAESLVSQQLMSRIENLDIESYQIHATPNSVCIRTTAKFVLPALAPIIDSIVSPTVQANAVAVLPNPISGSPAVTICSP